MRSEAREAAYVEFVTARQAHLRRIAYAVCGDWTRADEILHDALTRLYVAWPRLQRDGSEEAYVRRRIMRTNADRGGPPAADPARPPLVEALLTLPAKQRKAVLLHDWLGLSVEETAEELGTSAAGVRAQCERGRAALLRTPSTPSTPSTPTAPIAPIAPAQEGR
jgi:DNA-directed RNA polymerase specialized sigma24 family protein